MKNMELMRLFHFAGKLKELKRKGWKNKQIRNPESVGDHSFRVAFISMMIADELHVDTLKLLQMSLIHDLAESVVGDITPDCGITAEEKKRREENALREIFNKIPGGKYYIDLWLEYEEQRSPEAIALKNIDKFEMALQAAEYNSKDRTKDLSKFISDAENNIELPFIKSLVQDIRRKIEGFGGSEYAV